MAKPKVRRVHKVHKGRKVNLGNVFGGIPKAHAQSDSAGQYNPQGWNETYDYGTNPQGGNVPRQNIVPPGITHTPTPTQTPPSPPRHKGPTVYAKNMKTGEKQVYHGLTTLQERQNLAAAGFRLTTKPPPVTSADTGHYVGDVNMPDHLKVALDIGGPTNNQYGDDVLHAADVDPEQPRSVYAEEDVPRTDVPPNINSILHGTLPPYPPHTRTGPTRIRKKKGKLASGPFAAGDPNSLLRRVFGWGTRE